MNYKDYLQQHDPNDHTLGLDGFLRKFDCRIEDSDKYNQYVKQPTAYHRDFYPTDNFRAEIQIVRMKAIHLTSDNLARLLSEQEQMQHMKDDAELGKQLWREMMQDRAVRESNPAVEKAWRNYQMLLELARQ